MKYVYIYCMLCVIFSERLYAQDIEQQWNGLKERWHKDPLKVSTFVGWNSSYMSGQAISDYQSPFTNNLYGSINIDLLGIQAPLGFFFNMQNARYNLPSYRFVGISPSYNGYTLHVGDRNMQLSPYSFHQIGFTGVGAEVQQSKWHIKAMGGRIQRATIKDVNSHHALESKFARYGWGFGADYQLKNTLIGVHLFHAKDDISSLPIQNPDSIKPQRNAIVGCKLDQNLGPLKFRAEYAYNILNRDILNPEKPERNPGIGFLSGMAAPNTATGIYQAFKTGLDAQIKVVRLGVEFERVDPGYESLGSLFFNNDLATLSTYVQSPLFNNKLQTSLRMGMQRNNLDDVRTQSFKRWTIAASIQYKMSKNTSIGAHVNNFLFDQKSFINPTPYLDVDTILITQNNLNTGLNIQHAFSDKQRLLLNLNYNKSTAQQNNIDVLQSGVQSLVGNAVYSWEMAQDLNLAGTFTMSKLRFNQSTTTMLGPSIQISKDWKKDIWQSSCALSVFTGAQQEVTTTTYRLFLTNNYTITKELKTQLQLMLNHNQSKIILTPWELFANVGITYTLENKTLIKTFRKTKNIQNAE